ncbi:ribosome maturation factor RimP [Schaalia sp. ZJ405]|uniref:ribosome maturation factor RimP n=1 Tax=unclassified Schaalia TaxID=2691889 RepID=UPI0013EC9B22|nr:MULTISPECIES: ribosome maturation factor RimP [unclassified Schaalia]QPK81823.1 ribosome maturation factor RimP [Schaalia sp. ZJ405]
MAQPTHSPEIFALLEPVVTGLGVELDSVILANQSGTTVVRVFVDSPVGQDGVDADRLADVSRAVSAQMDRADPIDSEYLLEVSTPGAERELTQPRHWLKQVGRLAQVKLRDGQSVTGRVIDVGEDSVTLNIDDTTTTILYAQMKKARARVEFGSKE